MVDLPSPQTPLYNHPLPVLERWLAELGGRQRGHHSCEWDLTTVAWSAELVLSSEELTVRWGQGAAAVERRFSYGLTRADVEAAILAGP